MIAEKHFQQLDALRFLVEVAVGSCLRQQGKNKKGRCYFVTGLILKQTLLTNLLVERRRFLPLLLIFYSEFIHQFGKMGATQIQLFRSKGLIPPVFFQGSQQS